MRIWLSIFPSSRSDPSWLNDIMIHIRHIACRLVAARSPIMENPLRSLTFDIILVSLRFCRLFSRVQWIAISLESTVTNVCYACKSFYTQPWLQEMCHAIPCTLILPRCWLQTTSCTIYPGVRNVAGPDKIIIAWSKTKGSTDLHQSTRRCRENIAKHAARKRLIEDITNQYWPCVSCDEAVKLHSFSTWCRVEVLEDQLPGEGCMAGFIYELKCHQLLHRSRGWQHSAEESSISRLEYQSRPPMVIIAEKVIGPMFIPSPPNILQLIQNIFVDDVKGLQVTKARQRPLKWLDILQLTQISIDRL